MFEICQTWLVAVGAGMVVGGAALSLLGGTRLFAFLNPLIDPCFWKGAPDAGARRYQAWIYGVLGGAMAGWGLTMTILVAGSFSSRQGWVWWSLAAGVGLWFLLDTAQSLRYRVFVNAAVNTVVLVLMAIPLALTFGDFH